MASTSNQMRLQAKRVTASRKKSAKGHAKGKLLAGPKIRKLKIRA